MLDIFKTFAMSVMQFFQKSLLLWKKTETDLPGQHSRTKTSLKKKKKEKKKKKSHNGRGIVSRVPEIA